MALFNFIMDDRNKRQRYAEQEVAPTLMELYEASNQPPGPAPTNTNLNVDLPPTQPMTQQGLLGGLMRAGAYPEVTKAALKAQVMPSQPDLQRGAFYSASIGKDGQRFTGFTGKDGAVYRYMGDGRIVPAPADSILVSTQVSGGTEVLPESLRKKGFESEKLKTNIGRMGSTLSQMSELPNSIGVPGLVAEKLGGLLGQIPEAGPELERAFTKAVTGASPEQNKAMRSAFIDTSAAMLQAITGEESGRYTEQERALANEALGALKLTSTLPTARAGFIRGLQITLASQRREQRNAGQPIEDISTREGIMALGERLVKTGMSEADAKAVIRELIRIEGFQ